MTHFLDVLKKYAVFKGRARRQEYWMFVLISFLITAILGVVGALIQFPVFSLLFGLGILVPSLAVMVRRFHDTNRSGWWALIGLVPFVGLIVQIIFLAQNGQVGENKYGPDPKATPAS